MRSKLICLAVILTVAVSVRGVASGQPIGSRPIGCSGTKPVARASATDAPTALNIGPGTDEIDAIAVCPNDPDVVFVGTQDAGVWKSTDAGVSWASSNSGIKLDSPFELGIFSVAIEPSNPQTVYAGGASGIYKSSDGGGNWVVVKSTKGGLQSVTALAIDPTSTGVVYAASSVAGVLKSIDGGNTWSPMNSGLGKLLFVTAIAIDPSNPLILYAANGDVFRTEDGGVSWFSTTFPPIWVNSIAIDPHTPSTVYAAGDDYPGFESIYKSTDFGANWFPAGGAIDPKLPITALAIDPLNTDTVYVSCVGDVYQNVPGAGVYKTSDGGLSWSALNSGLTDPAVYALAIRPGDSTTIYAGATDGAFKSVDAGANWATVNGLPAAHIDSIAIDPNNPQAIYAGTDQAMIYSSTDAGATWKRANVSPIPQSTEYAPIFDIYGIAIDSSHPGTAYIGTNAGVAKSTDGGATWAATASLAGISLNPALCLTISAAGDLWAGAGYGLFETTDGGASWVGHDQGFHALGIGPPYELPISALALDPVPSGKAYAGTSTRIGVYVSNDGGNSWTKSSNGLPRTSALSINALAVNPLNRAIIYAGSYEGVFKTVNGAAKWTHLNMGLQDRTVSSLAIDPASPDVVYAGTDLGVLKSVDGGKHWALMPLPLISPIINALVVDPSSGALYVGSGAGLLRVTNGN